MKKILSLMVLGVCACTTSVPPTQTNPSIPSHTAADNTAQASQDKAGQDAQAQGAPYVSRPSVYGSYTPHVSSPIPSNPQVATAVPWTQRGRGYMGLLDKTVYLQKDPRWARERMGGSGEYLENDGCLVTATAMALSNLGVETDPGDLNARLKRANGYTSQGWLIWSGIEKATDGKATARFYQHVDEEIINQCISDGYYPLASFRLPNGRSHWAMIVYKSDQGYHMRDPLKASSHPLIFPRGAAAFRSVRCVGLKEL